VSYFCPRTRMNATISSGTMITAVMMKGHMVAGD
jgi:hypothetical protein